jgi:serine/threonine protein kinase
MIGATLRQRYRIDAELGTGGTSKVYRAHDLLLDRDVAIKVVGHNGLGSMGQTQLLREAQAVSRRNDPNIVSVYAAGEVDGLPFIVVVGFRIC